MDYKIGDVVKAKDRGNYGRITAIQNGGYSIHFVNPATGDERNKFFRDDGIEKASESDLKKNTSKKKSASKTKAKEKTKLITIRASDVEPKEIEWLWPNRIPLGMLTVIAGRQGSGKSSLSIDIAARISGGLQWPDNSGNAPWGTVLLLTAEEDIDCVVRPRLDAAGADANNIIIGQSLQVVTEGDETVIRSVFLQDADAIRDCLENELHDCKAIIVDPIGSYIGDADSHRDNEVRKALTPLAQLAKDFNLAAIAVCHTRKSGGELKQYADDEVMGSVAFTALARSVYHVQPDKHEKDLRYFVPGKINLVKPPPGIGFRVETHQNKRGYVVWGEMTDLSADDIVRGADDMQQGEKAELWLANLMKSGPSESTLAMQKAKEAGLSETTINRAKKKLGIASEKKGNSWFWMPPEGG